MDHVDDIEYHPTSLSMAAAVGAASAHADQQSCDPLLIIHGDQLPIRPLAWYRVSLLWELLLACIMGPSSLPQDRNDVHP